MFESEDKDIKKKALNNKTISQKNNYKLSESIKVNAKCLLSEFFILNNNNIKSRKFKKKVNIQFHALILVITVLMIIK